ncbi:MAG: dTDP-4-dehydrorhamnose 3,5-epimerase [Proteobacteria bacterium]|nr:dTDP-4-dehydrorhamnose 3,5-epimerase [Pseudomonadota bacterium]
MDIQETVLPGLLLIRPGKFGDERGYCYESWRLKDYRDAGMPVDFLQDNCSYSKQDVLRGLHIQKSQGQLLWPSYGHIFQVTVDVRQQSPTFGKCFTIELRHTEPTQIYMPPGFAGGFQVLSEFACMNYKCSQYYSPSEEGGILWSDPDLAIKWPVKTPIISERDQAFPCLKNIKASAFL